MYYTITDNELEISEKDTKESRRLLDFEPINMQHNSWASLFCNVQRDNNSTSIFKRYENDIIKMWEQYLCGEYHNILKGYVTTGSTEGNLLSLYWHRLYWQNKQHDATNINKQYPTSSFNNLDSPDKRAKLFENTPQPKTSPILYTSEASHYSIFKAGTWYQFNICKVKSDNPRTRGFGVF